VRVGPDKTDTGWVILVQERRDDVLQPVRDLQWRLGYGALGAGLFVLLLLVGLTAGMMSVLEAAPKSRVTRFLRRLAGLPSAGTAAAAATGTVGTIGVATPGGKTARVGSGGLATPAQSSEDRRQETGDGGQEPGRPEPDTPRS
jgi:hypothetical protein